MVKYLVENGADVNAQDNRGWTPLRYAYYYNYKEIAEILLKYNAVVSAVKDNPNGPWTGVWDVEGSIYCSGRWRMIQTGQSVKSTKYSNYEIEGNAGGNQLRGKIIDRDGLFYPIIINLSSDGLTFMGTIDTHWGGGKGIIKGKKE